MQESLASVSAKGGHWGQVRGECSARRKPLPSYLFSHVIFGHGIFVCILGFT